MASTKAKSLYYDSKETESRNQAIADFLGWFIEDGYTGSWFIINEPAKYVVYSEHNNYPHKGLPFDRDINYLLPAIEKLKKDIRRSNDTKNVKIGEYFIDEFSITLNTFYFKLYQWTETGWAMSGDKDNHHLTFQYIIGTNCEDFKDGLFKFVSHIIKVINKTD